MINIFFVLLSIVALAWDPNTELNLAGYNVYRSEQSGVYGSPINLQPIVVSSYEDITALQGKTFFYVVTALNVDGVESGRSNEVIAVVPDIIPPSVVMNEIGECSISSY